MSRDQMNIDVLKQLKAGQPLSPDAIQGYSGWGGLRERLYDKAVYRQLKQCLSDDEIISLKQTLTNGYYTPQPMVTAMYQGLDQLGARYQCVLEPAAGVGAFLGDAMARQAATIIAVELDQVSCQLLTAQFPDITLIQGGFEQVKPEAMPACDVVIGNPPYGRQKIRDLHDARFDNLVIHHYFFAKAMTWLSEGGLLTMVLPAYCLDNPKRLSGKAYLSDKTVEV